MKNQKMYSVLVSMIPAIQAILDTFNVANMDSHVRMYIGEALIFLIILLQCIQIYFNPNIKDTSLLVNAVALMDPHQKQGGLGGDGANGGSRQSTAAPVGIGSGDKAHTAGQLAHGGFEEIGADGHVVGNACFQHARTRGAGAAGGAIIPLPARSEIGRAHV